MIRLIPVIATGALFLIATLAFFNAQRAQINAERIERLEDTGLSRAAAYRLCERLSRVKAELRIERPDRARFTEQHLPIVDCTPNLRGQEARFLSPSQQRRYVRDYAAGRLSALPEVDEHGVSR